MKRDDEKCNPVKGLTSIIITQSEGMEKKGRKIKVEDETEYRRANHSRKFRRTKLKEERLHVCAFFSSAGGKNKEARTRLLYVCQHLRVTSQMGD